MHSTRQPEFDRIVAHRIDVVDRKGSLAMVLTDHDDFPDPVMNGKTGHRTGGGDENGIVFYNQDGNEQGALIWDGRRGPHGASSHNTLSYNTAESDQLLQLNGGSDEGKHYAGLYAHTCTHGSAAPRRSAKIPQARLLRVQPVLRRL